MYRKLAGDPGTPLRDGGAKVWCARIGMMRLHIDRRKTLLLDSAYW
jgi:hypothetical protein